MELLVDCGLEPHSILLCAEVKTLQHIIYSFTKIEVLVVEVELIVFKFGKIKQVVNQGLEHLLRKDLLFELFKANLSNVVDILELLV